MQSTERTDEQLICCLIIICLKGGLLKLSHSSTVEKRNLLQTLIEGGKEEASFWLPEQQRLKLLNTWSSGEAARDELKVMADFRMQANGEKKAGGWGWGPLEIHTDDWEITGAQTVDKHTGNYRLTKQTSHHQHQTTQSENTPSSFTNLICHQPQPNCCFFSPFYFFFFFSLHTPEGPADLRWLSCVLGKHEGIGPVGFPRLHAGSHSAPLYYTAKHLQ